MIKGDPENGEETVITNCQFECGNANLIFNVALKDFGATADGYLGVVFRYLKIKNDEE